MKLQYPKAYGSGCIFREDFTSWQHVADNGGIVTGVPTISNGITETVSNASRVLYSCTRNLFVLSQTAMTIVLDLTTTPAPPAGGNYFVVKGTIGVSAQFIISQFAGRNLRCYVPTTPADLGTVGLSSALSDSTRYRVAFVFNGAGVGNANRLPIYINGVLDAGASYAGTIPASILSLSEQIGIFQLAAIAGAKINQLRIFDRALSADEILDDYQQDVYTEIEAGP